MLFVALCHILLIHFLLRIIITHIKFTKEKLFHEIIPLTIISCALAQLVVYFILHVKRFKSGMPFLSNNKVLHIGLVVSTLIMIAFLFSHNLPQELYTGSATVQLLACLLFIPFIAWWRTQLSKSYCQYLRDMETKNLIAKVEQLSADNQQLSQIVHKGNKLITAMISSVLNLIEQAPSYSTQVLLSHSESLY